MKLLVSVSVSVVLAAIVMPAFAQSGKDALTDKVAPKTYKRKLYDGKDADKYRAMKDVQYFDGNRKNRPKGGHEDQNKSDGTPEQERSYTQKQYRISNYDAARENSQAEEGNIDRAERREARPVTRQDDGFDRSRGEAREQDMGANENAKEEQHEHNHEAGESRRSYRREMRGSRKEMRRKSREDKWTSGSDH